MPYSLGMETNNPQTLVEAIRYFSDAETSLGYMVKMRWPNGVECPTCGRKDVAYLANQRRWKCKGNHPKKQFSVKVGTIFEDSPLSLEKWLSAVWMITNAKNGISSYEIHRAIGVTQKSAWFMLHRIRLAMQKGSFVTKLGGEVEVDETYIGGKARNMHKSRRRPGGTGMVGKSIVMGLLERDGEVRTHVVPTSRGATLRPHVHAHVEKGATVYTDALQSYLPLAEDYSHKIIDHAKSYVNGSIHTNGLENFWSLLKRTIKGTYVAVEPFHLFRYLDEQSFRFNNRKMADGQRFNMTLGGVRGKRLTYKALIGVGASSSSPDSGGESAVAV